MSVGHQFLYIIHRVYQSHKTCEMFCKAASTKHQVRELVTGKLSHKLSPIQLRQ